MSLLPYVMRPVPNRVVDQEFGLQLTSEDLLTAMAPMVTGEYYRPWRNSTMTRDMGSTIVSKKDRFQINLDVQHFSPEEITVKTVDGYVVIEGKHEERKDEHGYISRQFTRRYALPENCDAATVESKLSSDGVLTVIAPRKSTGGKNERNVPIAQTGPVRRETKDAGNQQTSQTDGDANGTDA